jgi:hypothetical protein
MYVVFIAFTEWYLARIAKIFFRLALSHATASDKLVVGVACYNTKMHYFVVFGYNWKQHNTST